MASFALPLAAETILPHRPPMLLVDQLEQLEGETAVVSACLGDDCVLAGENGELDGVIYAELVAQAYAAFKGYELLQAGEAIKEGFLVGIRKMQVTGKASVKDSLRITVTTVGLLQGFAVVDGVVAKVGASHVDCDAGVAADDAVGVDAADIETVAEVRLKLYVPEEGGPEVGGAAEREPAKSTSQEDEALHSGSGVGGSKA